MLGYTHEELSSVFSEYIEQFASAHTSSKKEILEKEYLRPEAILFQAGYITIKQFKEGFFTLGYPNQEVKLSLLKHLFFAFAKNLPHGEDSKFLKLSRHLQKEDFTAFFKAINAIFSSIPYNLQSKRDEGYYHTLFYLMISASGANTRCEVLTSRGRIDLEIEFSDKISLSNSNVIKMPKWP